MWLCNFASSHANAVTHTSSVPIQWLLGGRQNVLEFFPNVEFCTKGRLPPWGGHSQHPGYPDAPGRVTELAHPQPKRHQVTKPNPHLGISSTPAILYIALTSILITVLIMAIETCVSFFFGGLTWQSYQALGPLGPLLSLTLITGCGFMFRVDIEDTKYSGLWWII